MLFLPGPGQMGGVKPDPIFTEVGSNGINNSAHSSLTISSVDIPAGDVYAVVAFNSNRQVSSIVIDGTDNMVELLDVSNGSARMGIWGISGYGGGTGVDVVITPYGGVTFSNAILMSVENPRGNAESAEFTNSSTSTSNVNRVIDVTNTNSRKLAIFGGIGNSGTPISMTGETGEFNANFTFKVGIGYVYPADGDDPVSVTVNTALCAGGVVLNA